MSSLKRQLAAKEEQFEQLPTKIETKCTKKKVTETKDIFEAERIVQHKKEGEKILYLVRWRGYGSNDDTWEPEENLMCPSLLREYNQK